MADVHAIRVLYLVVSDGFATDPSTGKKSLYGLFDRIGVASFPASHPTLTITIGLQGGEGTYEIWIELRDPAGKEIVRSPTVPVSPKDPYRREDMIIQLNALSLNTSGRHEVAVMSKQGVLGVYPIFVEQKS